MKIKQYIVIVLVLASMAAQAQDVNKDTINVFDRKKLFWGLTFNQAWVTFKGDNLPETYFAKPALGGDLMLEYYPVKFAGIRIGAGYMQRGAGIKLVDRDHSLGNPDSTYRTRLRMNTIQVPIMLVLRTPHDVIKGMRLAGGVGVVGYNNFQTNRLFDSVEDGFHLIEKQTGMYMRRDIGFQAFFGTHLSVANFSQLQVELVYTKGTKNVYRDATFGDANGRQQMVGFRVSWVY